MGYLTLIGIGSDKKDKPISEIYENIMQILEKRIPRFVSEQIRLYNPLNRFYSPLFYATIHELRERGTEILHDSGCGVEYGTGIIYCRRSVTPLHWIDLYSGSLENVTKTNVLRVNPKILWWNHKPIPKKLLRSVHGTNTERWLEINHRNEFMAEAISQLMRKYHPLDGVHIGNSIHYEKESEKSIQQYLTGYMYITDIEIINL